MNNEGLKHRRNEAHAVSAMPPWHPWHSLHSSPSLRSWRLSTRGVALLALLAATCGPVAAQTPALFREADLGLGQKLMAEHKCAACHASKVGGDGSAIYRPKGRINNPGALRGMVDLCSTELNLGLFPEEVTAVAAVLNRDHYRFGVGGQ